ncbi:MAG: transglycosylase SLT domain-containing protein [Atribacterota bacterium]
MKAKIVTVLLLVFWSFLFVFGARGKDDAWHFLFVTTLIHSRAKALAQRAVISSLEKEKILGDHLALLFLERCNPPKEEKARLLDLLEHFFPESPVSFHAALFSAQKEQSFSFAIRALRLAPSEEEKLSAFETLFVLLKEKGFYHEAALLLARMYRDFRDQTTVKTRREMLPLLPFLTPESFSPPSRLSLAELFLSLGFLGKAEEFLATLEDAFLLKARLFLRKGDLKALERLLEGQKESEDVLWYRAVLAQRMGRQLDALSLYEELLTRFPQSAYALNALRNIASMYKAQGQTKEYIATLERAVRLFPRNGSLLSDLFFALYESKDLTKAQNVLRDLAAIPEWRNQALFWSFKISQDTSYLATILEESRLDYYYVRASQILGHSSPFKEEKPPPLSLSEPLATSWTRYRLLSSFRLWHNAAIELLSLLRRDPKNPSLLLEASLLLAQRGLYPKSIRLALRLFPEKGKIPEFAGKAYYPLAFFKDIEKFASQHNPPLDPYLILALVHAESLFDHEAVSIAGAIGLAQVMPQTGAWVIEKGWVHLGRNPENIEDALRNPKENLAIGIAYLAYLFRRFEKDVVLALCGYNAGPGRADEWQKRLPPDRDMFIESIPFPETKNYVKKVLTNYFAYTALYRGVTAFPNTF